MHVHDVSDRVKNAASEDALFRLALEVEADAALDEPARHESLELIGRAIDARRVSVGIGTQPTFAQLREHWDGPPPAALDDVRADLPAGATAVPSEYVETIAGRTRLLPTVTVHYADGSTAGLLPSPIRSRRRHRP